MKVLDLFAGLEGWAAPFRDRGHEVFSVDNDERFTVDLHADVFDLVPADLPWRPDIIVASPPCEAFSVLRIGANWTGSREDRRHAIEPHQPRTEDARIALALVERTVWFIGECDPSFFVIENPRAKLRRLPVVAELERRTVTYCKLGLPVMKPTDLWGGFPPSLRLPAPCDTRNAMRVGMDGVEWVVDNTTGRPCHIAAPRGSTTGTQGSLEWHKNRRGNLTMHKRQQREMHGTSDTAMLAAKRAKVPYDLGQLVCLAAEHDLAAKRRSLIAMPTLWDVGP